jgi:hypothetical protein
MTAQAAGIQLSARYSPLWAEHRDQKTVLALAVQAVSVDRRVKTQTV